MKSLARLHEEKENALLAETPPHLRCPITLQRMRSPVVCADGHSFERRAIANWLKSHSTNPLTGAALPNNNLVSALSLRDAIREWEAAHKREMPPAGPPSPAESTTSSFYYNEDDDDDDDWESLPGTPVDDESLNALRQTIEQQRPTGPPGHNLNAALESLRAQNERAQRARAAEMEQQRARGAEQRAAHDELMRSLRAAEDQRRVERVREQQRRDAAQREIERVREEGRQAVERAFEEQYPGHREEHRRWVESEEGQRAIERSQAETRRWAASEEGRAAIE